MSDPKLYESTTPQRDVGNQIIVGFDEKKLGGVTVVAARQRIEVVLDALRDFGATVLSELIAIPPDKTAFFAIAVIRLPPGTTLDEFRKELHKEAYADVGWVERNAPIALAGFNDPLFAQQWALETLGATQPWTVSPPAGNPRTVVAIVDSGLRLAGGGVHVDLGPVEPVNVCQPPGFFPQCHDRDGHGTFLAGTIAAVPGNNAGISSAIEPSWNIKLLPVQFFSPDVPPNAAYAAFAIVHAALALFQLHQRKVINASWRVAPGDAGLEALRKALDIAVNLLGCLVVFAAGNDGTDNEIFPLYPARFGSEPAFVGKVLTALATDRYDAKASFSNYGRTTVDLGAPGLGILSTARYLVNPPRYADYSGTSPAAAYVSAGAALVFALHPFNWDGAGAAAWTPADVVQHLKASAKTIETLKLACIGGKRLSLKRAVYGPLRLTAPAAGAVFTAGLPNNIAWVRRYNNPKLTRVKIEFSATGNPPYKRLSPLAGWPIGAPFPWTPNPLTDKTPNGRIRITPLEGNFRRTSRLFSVV